MSQWDEISEQGVAELVEAGRRGDADAAFRLAAYAFEHGQSEAADSWMLLAARFGGPAMLWRLADLVKGDSNGERAARWQRQAIAAEWGREDVAIDEDTCRVFVMHDGSYRTQEFGAHVRGEPNNAVRTGLIRAARRLMSVDNKGVEYPEDDEDELVEADYSPNFMSEPEEHPDGGWYYWMDCKGEVFPLMAATQLRILVDELRAAGVTAIRIGPLPDDRDQII